MPRTPSTQRFNIPDHDTLTALLGMSDPAAMKSARREWAEESLRQEASQRECGWTDSLAIGNQEGQNQEGQA